MRICVFSLKGGQGKSSVSAEIALNLGAGIVTNEPYSILESIVDKKSLITIGATGKLPDIPQDIPLIYDFGGYVDNRVLEACRISDFIIIPINPLSDGDTQAGIHTAKELEQHKDKIVFVCNMADKKEANKVNKTMKHFFPENPVFTINKSKAISNLRHNKKPISELVASSNLDAYLYRNVHLQIQLLINHLRQTK